MDYLDSKKQFREHVVLITGYILIAIAITIATLLLVESAYGFGLAQNGTVIQNGLVFLSSQPNPANVYLNNKLTSYTTNTRLFLPSGVYKVELTRNGYRPWNRTIVFEAGSVEHFDYPFLFPTTLTTKKIHTYDSAPGLATQSPSRQWLLIEQPGSMTNFDLYDFSNPASPKMTTISLPSNLLSKATTSESWQFDEWADDNQHVLLTHVYDGKTEYILVDCADPSQSVNLTTMLGTNPTQLTLNNKKYNQYYVYNAASDNSIETATLATGNVLTPYLQDVSAYQSYGSNTMLYVTSDGAPSGKVLLKLLSGNQTITIRTLPVSPSYLLDLTGYSGELYVAAGATSEGQIYIYPNPIGQYAAQQGTIVPSQVLNVPQANYLSFSDNAEFIVAEHNSSFAVYDIENQKTYDYTKNLPLDAPQLNASWMDGDRLVYTSGGKLIVFDYDGTNQQTLMSESPAYLPDFTTNYDYIVSLDASAGTGKFELDRTPLLTPTDL
jgi:hypothetical protein